VRLDEEQARHVRALRLTEGDVVRLTDGHGTMWQGRLTALGADGTLCTLDTPVDVSEALPLCLAFGIGNKTHTLWLVEKATELGVETLQPLEFARSRSVADAARSTSFWSKAERRAAAALEQSGGGRLPHIRPPIDLAGFVSRFAEREPVPAGHPASQSVLRVWLDRGGSPLGNVLRDWSGDVLLVVVVGPEGGLLETEAGTLVEAGFVRARLAGGVLRFETAAVAGAAVAAQHLEIMRTTRDSYGDRP